MALGMNLTVDIVMIFSPSQCNFFTVFFDLYRHDFEVNFDCNVDSLVRITRVLNNELPLCLKRTNIFSLAKVIYIHFFVCLFLLH